MAEESNHELQIGLDTICAFVDMAHEFDAKDSGTDPDSSSDGADDRMIDVLEDDSDDAVEEELTSFINDLSEDAQIDLVALMWLGRGDDTEDDWSRLRDEAARAHNGLTARYLLGEPLLGSHLEEGLAKLGLSCKDAG